MAFIVERESFSDPLHQTRAFAALGGLGWLAIAGPASLGAGAIHAAAIGVHAEHRQAVVAFTVVAAMQIGFGAAAIARPGRRLLILGAVVNTAIVGGWVLAKSNGISFVDGLGEAEPPQMADSLAAGLAVVAVVATLAELLSSGSRAPAGRPRVAGASAILVAALALPGMLAAGSHSHAGGHSDGHGHASTVPPKPYDPSLPIDLSGVEGVTPHQQAAAENLLALTITRLPQFADYRVAESMGFLSLGDGDLGHEHYLNVQNMADDKLLDPDYPESLVYDTSVTPKKLVAAMYMLNKGDTLADVPELGGKLTQWHIHDDEPCSGTGECGIGGFIIDALRVPMMHVWTEPHPCGPFAALEGKAGGTIATDESRLCDHAHGAG